MSLTASQVEKAKVFATHKHDGQKGKRPGEAYIDHVEAVIRLLKKHGEVRTHVLAAAYLHDCLEKTDTTISELMRDFGERIAELVYWLTDPEEVGVSRKGAGVRLAALTGPDRSEADQTCRHHRQRDRNSKA